MGSSTRYSGSPCGEIPKGNSHASSQGLSGARCCSYCRYQSCPAMSLQVSILVLASQAIPTSLDTFSHILHCSKFLRPPSPSLVLGSCSPEKFSRKCCKWQESQSPCQPCCYGPGNHDTSGWTEWEDNRATTTRGSPTLRATEGQGPWHLPCSGSLPAPLGEGVSFPDLLDNPAWRGKPVLHVWQGFDGEEAFLRPHCSCQMLLYRLPL